MDLIRNSGLDPVSNGLRVELELGCHLIDREKLIERAHRQLILTEQTSKDGNI